MKQVFPCGHYGQSVMPSVLRDEHFEAENVWILRWKLVRGRINKTVHVMLVRVQVCILFSMYELCFLNPDCFLPYWGGGEYFTNYHLINVTLCILFSTGTEYLQKEYYFSVILT